MSDDARVALVTGAAGALGAAICTRLEDDGYAVVGVDLVAEPPLVQADVGTAMGNAQIVDAAVERFGRLDVLVLNAGVQHVAPIATFPEAEWDRLFDVMVKGPFLAMRAAWPALTARPGGRVVMTASTSSFVAEARKSAYVSAKHALLGLMKVAALEGAEHGLTVNAVAPGWMLTPMAERQVQDRVAASHGSYDAAVADLLAGQPVKRFVTLDEVARVVAFLADPGASAVTGVAVPVDLGALVV